MEQSIWETVSRSADKKFPAFYGTTRIIIIITKLATGPYPVQDWSIYTHSTSSYFFILSSPGQEPG
jgi:hypothetical protein